MERGVTKGWPLVLASLKSWLETGKPVRSDRRKSRPPEPH